MDASDGRWKGTAGEDCWCESTAAAIGPFAQVPPACLGAAPPAPPDHPLGPVGIAAGLGYATCGGASGMARSPSAYAGVGVE